MGTIDLSTGAFNVLGNTGTLLIGIGEHGGKVYGGDVYGDTLYQVNLIKGSLTTIGTGSIDYNEFASTASGLYALGTNSDLYSININPSNGAATLIGPLGFSIGGTIGMSAGPRGRYYAQGGNLYVI